MKLWYIPLGIILIAGVAAAGYFGFRSTQPAAQPQQQTAPATVRVERGVVSLGVTAPGRLIGVRETLLSFDATGKIVELTVRPGEKVEAGATLARLDTEPLTENVATAETDLELARARLAKLEAGPSTADSAAAQADLVRAQARLDELNRGPNASDLASARSALASAEAALTKLKTPDATAVQNAQYALETAKNSLWSAQVGRDAACGAPNNNIGCDQAEAGVGNADAGVRQAQDALARAQAGPNADDVKVAELNVQQARARLAQLSQKSAPSDLKTAQLAFDQARLNDLNAGPNAVDKRQAQATVQAAELALKRAQADLQAANLTAPYAGIVLEVKASQGETVNRGAPVLKLTDPTQVEVEATVVEEDFALVKPGLAADLFFDAQPAAAIHGRLARIIPQRSGASTSPVYPIYITLDAPEPNLVPGMTAGLWPFGLGGLAYSSVLRWNSPFAHSQGGFSDRRRHSVPHASSSCLSPAGISDHL